MITYMGMTLPISFMAVISWIKNPYKKGKEKVNEVKIHRLTKKQVTFMIVFAIAVTWIFYYILKYFNTPNLFFSTVSVTTSFLAVYLTFFRSSYYAVCYSLNDIVLIILWILASIKDFSYFPMVICFIVFFINDLYGFVSWRIREKKQGIKQELFR